MKDFYYIFKANSNYPLNKAKNSSAQVAAATNARFWKHNTFIVLAMGCNLINCLYYAADEMISSAIIEVTGIVMLFAFMFFNRLGLWWWPKIISIVCINLHCFFLCYFQGTRQGSYLYLFPFMMAMIFFLRVRKNNLVVTAFITASTLNLLASVIFLPYQALDPPIPDAVANSHLVLNIIMNFLLVIVFF